MIAIDVRAMFAAEGLATPVAEPSAFLRWWLAGIDVGIVAAWNSGAASSDEASRPADAADWVVVQAAVGGDGDAFADLVRRHQQPIAAYVWRFTRDRAAWEELVHDVFVEAYFSLARYRGRAPLLHWLKKIATRVGYRYWKSRARQRREVPLTDEHASTLPAPATAAAEAGERVHRLLARLAPRDRLVLTLLYLEDCTTAEVAALTGWSEVMVKVQAHRARKRLQKLWPEAESFS